MLSIQKRLSPGRARAMGTCRTMPKKAKACPEPLRGPPAPGPSPPQRDRWCLAERANQGPGERARPTGSQWVSVAERWLYGREPIAAGGAGPRARREAQVRGVRRRPAGHPLPCGASPVSAHLPGRWAEAGTQTLTYGGPRRRDDDHGVRACTHLVAPLLASRQPATEAMRNWMTSLPRGDTAEIFTRNCISQYIKITSHIQPPEPREIMSAADTQPELEMLHFYQLS